MVSKTKEKQTAPWIKRTAVQSTFPASFDTWQVYLAESLGLTEWSSKELEEESFFMKQFPPVKISFSSLNHLTTRGADPVKMDFNTTLDPGATF